MNTNGELLGNLFILLASEQRFSANFQGQGRRPMAESLWAKIKLESCFYDSQT